MRGLFYRDSALILPNDHVLAWDHKALKRCCLILSILRLSGLPKSELDLLTRCAIDVLEIGELGLLYKASETIAFGPEVLNS